MKPPPPPQTLDWLPALRTPALTAQWSPQRWERVVRIARPLRLLARLGEAVGVADAAAADPPLPPQAARALLAEVRVSRWRSARMRWAIERIGRTLADAPYRRLLLKGGAYLAQDLAIAAGRLPSDLDILVAREHVADAQRRLFEAGWSEVDLPEQDRRYYREWSHEVPPMVHQAPALALELDLHHHIVPPVASLRVDAAAIVAAARPCGLHGWHVPAPADQVLHCAAHLFLDAELRDRARDLVDLDGLLQAGAAAGGDAFWPTLDERAARLGLRAPLALGVAFCVGWLGTPVPPQWRERWQRAGARGPAAALQAALFARVLAPADPDRAEPLAQQLAAVAVLARYHLWRLPVRRAVPHLWRKWRLHRAPELFAPEPPARD